MDDSDLMDEEGQKKKPQPLKDEDLHLDDVSGEDNSARGSGIETDTDTANEMNRQ